MTQVEKPDRPRIRVNGKETDLSNDVLAELMAAHGSLHAKGVAVALNGIVVPREGWPAQRLANGDRIEIIKIKVGG
jgi:sulfur carrier protein